ncbi:hypothetical protein B0H11DRAFT_2275818 [Mycena galericulata]|nr:hypothetical protein B0H11DRAFT_2275818 [Mycena galericulata]
MAMRLVGDLLIDELNVVRGPKRQVKRKDKAPSRTTSHSTEAIYKQIRNGTINLDPEYQRAVVWPEAKQSGIIHSFFNNYFIPQVIFVVTYSEDGTEKRTCIDGKQRLTSIYRCASLCPHPSLKMITVTRYWQILRRRDTLCVASDVRGMLILSNQSPLRRCLDKDADTGEKFWYCDNPAVPMKSAKKIIPEKYRAIFDNKSVQCVEYSDLNDVDERDIFQRVQLGVALTAAEKLRVISTPRAHFVSSLLETFLPSETSALAALEWDRARAVDFRCFAQTVQRIAIYPKPTSIQGTERWLADPAPLPAAFIADVENTYRVFEALAGDPRWKGVFSQQAKLPPVEFIMVGVLVHQNKGKLGLEGLAEAVREMQRDVRLVYDDIRNNSKVCKKLMAFIAGYRRTGLAEGEVCAANAVRGARAGEGSVAGGGVASGDRLAAGTESTSRVEMLATVTKPPTENDDEGETDSDDGHAPARRSTEPQPPPASSSVSSSEATIVARTPPASFASAFAATSTPLAAYSSSVPVPIAPPASVGLREGDLRAVGAWTGEGSAPDSAGGTAVAGTDAGSSMVTSGSAAGKKRKKDDDGRGSLDEDYAPSHKRTKPKPASASASLVAEAKGKAKVVPPASSAPTSTAPVSTASASRTPGASSSTAAKTRIVPSAPPAPFTSTSASASTPLAASTGHGGSSGNLYPDIRSHRSDRDNSDAMGEFAYTLPARCEAEQGAFPVRGTGQHGSTVWDLWGGARGL